MNTSFEHYGNHFQERLSFLILDDRVFSDRIMEVLKIEFLETKYLQWFVEKIFDYKKKYKTHPSRETMEMILKSTLDKENELLQKQIKEFYARNSTQAAIENAEFIKNEALDFCRKQKLHEAMIKAAQLLKGNSFDEIKSLIDNAMKAGAEIDNGHDYIKDFEKRYVENVRFPIATGWEKINEITGGGIGRGEYAIIMGGSGCHAAGTPILMSDGTIKNVEDVIVGDKLMGINSSHRKVLSLCRGKEEMFKIIPTKGEPFVVNGEHILSLKRKHKTHHLKQEVIDFCNISIKEYLNKSVSFKNDYKLYREKVNHFEKEREVLFPYFLGLMLGDGSFRKSLSFTNKDKILLDEIKNTLNYFDMDLKSREDDLNYLIQMKSLAGKGFQGYSKLRAFLRELKLDLSQSGTKFIPYDYKTSTLKNRLLILAGLLDTGGSYCNGCFDYVSKSKQLAEDVCFIARSVGLAAYLKQTIKYCHYKGEKRENIYFRVSISGDCSIIPTKVLRKQAKERKQIKDVCVTGFKIEKLSFDNFYGFNLDGDHLYLLGDFTVTHNSGKTQLMVHYGANAIKEGKNVLFYTLELRSEVIGQRFDACLSGIPVDELKQHKDEVLKSITDIKGQLRVKFFPKKSASIITIRNHIERLKMEGFVPDVIILDYLDLLKTINVKKEFRYEIGETYDEFEALNQELNTAGLTASQINRVGAQCHVVLMEHISEAFNKHFGSYLTIGLARDNNDKVNNTGRISILKNRNGPDGMVFNIFMDAAKVDIKVLGEYDEDSNVSSLIDPDEENRRMREKYKKFKAKGAI